MSTNQAALVRRWFEEVWNQRRIEAIAEMAASNIVAHGMGQHGVEVGIEQLTQFVQTIQNAFSDIHMTVESIITEGDMVAARWTSTVTHKGEFLGIAATGRKVTFTGMTMVRIAAGKIAEGWNSWDQLAVLVQIGAVPLQEIVARPDAKSQKAS